MRFVRKLCAWIIGIVLFVAGFLKLMDPVGAGLVVTEYFKFFGVGFLAGIAKPVAVAMALFETILGAAVITGVWRKVVAAIAAVVLGGFTILTLVLWIANPEMDCGCFGEAIHLTHAQSLLKNVVLCLLWVGAYIPFSKMLPTPKVKYVGFALAALSVAAFAIWSLRSVPMIDFTPFAPGQELLGDEYDPDAQVLSFSDASGEYADSLATHGKVLVISAYEPSRLSASKCEAVRAAVENAALAGCTPVVLVAGPADAEGPLSGLPVYSCDRKTLMTFNRSNGGASYLDDGEIIAKWPVRSLPGSEELSALTAMDPVEAMVESNNPPRLKVQAFLLYVFAVMLLL